MPSLHRRRFLTFGASAAVVALAGCAGTENASPYTDWLPAPDDSMLTAYLNLGLSEQTSKITPLLPLFLPSTNSSEEGRLVPDLSALDQVDEPLLRFPLQTGGRVISFSTLSLAAAGLGYLIDPETPKVGVTELFLANDTVVGTGEIDVSKADASLRAGDEDFLGEVRFEAVDDSGDYTVYQPTADLTGTVAVSDSAVLVADTRSQVQTAIETRHGNHSRATASNDTLQWLFEHAGAGDILVGWLGSVELGDFTWGDREPDLAIDAVSAESDVLSSVQFQPDTREITAEFALQESDVGDTAPSRLASQLGTSGDGSSLSIDGEQVSATATYTEDAIDVDFVEPATPTQTPTVPRGEDLPQKVAAAVPENAFSFSYTEDKGVVRVTFVKEFEADKVTVRAVNSGSETSSTTPEALAYLSVYLGSGSDEVVVIVTVDGVSGAVAREQFPR